MAGSCSTDNIMDLLTIFYSWLICKNIMKSTDKSSKNVDKKAPEKNEIAKQ